MIRIDFKAAMQMGCRFKDSNGEETIYIEDIAYIKLPTEHTGDSITVDFARALEQALMAMPIEISEKLHMDIEEGCIEVFNYAYIKDMIFPRE